MRFKEFISEEYDEFFNEEDFERDCQFYFNAMKGNGLLLHGTNKPITAGERVAFKPRTKARDSKQSLHDQANDFFEEKFRLPFRNGLFVSGKESVAREYGKNTAIIVPVGKFEWVSSPDIRDLYGDFEKFVKRAWDRGSSDGEAEDEDGWQDKWAEEQTLKKLETSRWYHNEQLPKCVAGLNEVMLWCPKGFYTFTKINLPRKVLEK